MIKITTIHTDPQGETHFGIRELPGRQTAFGPPPNPMGELVDFGKVTTMFAFSVPAGTSVPAHNAPQNYVCILLSGTLEVTASDGESRNFGPGDVLLCTDLSGKGHLTRAVTDAAAMFVHTAGG